MSINNNAYFVLLLWIIVTINDSINTFEIVEPALCLATTPFIVIIQKGFISEIVIILLKTYLLLTNTKPWSKDEVGDVTSLPRRYPSHGHIFRYSDISVDILDLLRRLYAAFYSTSAFTAHSRYCSRHASPLMFIVCKYLSGKTYWSRSWRSRRRGASVTSRVPVSARRAALPWLQTCPFSSLQRF